MCKSIDKAKTWKDVDQVVMRSPHVCGVRQTGSHKIVHSNIAPGAAVYPIHPGDAPRGTLRSVVSMLLKLGLVAALAVKLAPVVMAWLAAARF
jgi:hypothetical protein